MTRLQGWALAGCVAGLLACGDPTCPKGAIMVDGDCVPVQECGAGEVERNGECVAVDAGMDTETETETETKDAGRDGSTPPPTPDAGSTVPPPQADPCEALDCSGHGRCEPNNEHVLCVCDEGYAGDACETCSAGLGPAADGACVPLCEAEAAPDCGAHGACVADDAAASCECEHPYAGELCEGCAEAFALDDDGVCQPDCGDCGAHAFCDGTLMVPACTCVAGYRREGSNGCRWVGDGETGGIVDGDLELPAAWEARHVAITDGKATFVSSGVGAACELGVLSQTLTMPAFEDAEPLVLELKVWTSCTATSGDDCPALQVEFGESVTRVRVPGAASPTQRTVTACLGRSGYGGEVPLRIRPGIAREAVTSWSCVNDNWPVIESMALRAAMPDECPPDGGVASPEFDAPTGWSLTNATIQSGALRFTGMSAEASATSRIVFPAPNDVPAQELRISYSLETAGEMSLYLDGLLWGFRAFPAALEGSNGSLQLCVPDWAQGSVHELRFTTGATISFQRMTIETESLCGDGAFDRGFERGIDTGSWYLASGIAQVQTVGFARFGSKSLAIEAQVIMRGLTRVPEPVNDEGHAAFVFWHTLNGSNVNGRFQVIPYLPEVPSEFTNFSGQAWAAEVQCIGRAWEGQLMPMYFWTTLTLASGTGAAIGWLDDAGPVISDVCL